MNPSMLFAVMHAWLSSHAPTARTERGANTLEIAIIVIAVVAVAGVVVVAITSAVQKRASQIQ